MSDGRLLCINYYSDDGRGELSLLFKTPTPRMLLSKECIMLSMEATLGSRFILFVYAAPPWRCLLLFFDGHHRRAAVDG